jgi:hypothetical protein
MKPKLPGKKSAIIVGICFIAATWLIGTKRLMADTIKVLVTDGGEKIIAPDCARHRVSDDDLLILAGCLTPSIVFPTNHPEFFSEQARINWPLPTSLLTATITPGDHDIAQTRADSSLAVAPIPLDHPIIQTPQTNQQQAFDFTASPTLPLRLAVSTLSLAGLLCVLGLIRWQRRRRPPGAAASPLPTATASFPEPSQPALDETPQELSFASASQEKETEAKENALLGSDLVTVAMDHQPPDSERTEEEWIVITWKDIS